MSITSLNLVDLDFESLKTDLIKFLQNQAIFKDYNFVGSNLNVLMDLLSYNTNKNAFLVNMLLSEAFLDSAQLLSSVVSQAKVLNYLPRSARSSSATVTVNFSATGNNQPYIIKKGDSFSTLVKNSSYVFSIPENIIVSSANNNFSFTTDIFEGTYVQDAYIYNSANSFPRFRLTNKNVDTTSLIVGVLNAGSTNVIPFSQVTSTLGLTNLSQVYFLQASDNGFYEVIFGDNIIGQTPSNNATIILDYRICNASLPNGALNFSINFDPTGISSELINGFSNNPQTITVNPAANGDDPESIESIRFFAPRFFQTQERAIVPSDYEVLLKTQFPEINAVSAFGGEDAVPPLFGKVIVSVNISGIPVIPNSKVVEYTNFLRQRCPMSIQPIFINPEFTYLLINSTVKYNVNLTTNTPNFINSLVATTINNYNTTFLNNFNTTFRFSQLLSLIDDSDQSIISNVTTVKAYKKIQPTFGVPAVYFINFGFPFSTNFFDTSQSHPINISKCLSSDNFMSTGTLCFLEDDGAGNVNLSTNQSNTTVIKSTVGAIDYINGLILLNNLQIDGLMNNQTQLKVYITPDDPDVAAVKNTILLIEPSGTNITILPLSE